MSKEINLKAGMQFSRANVVQNSFNKESGTFDITFATETPVLRYGWEENYNEVLLCDPSNVRQERINSGLPLLNTHPYGSRVVPEEVMGKISNVRFENKTLVGTVTLGAQCTEQTRADLENGILDTFSVGYSIYKGVRYEDNVSKEVTYQMTDWEPNHVAIAPIPADINSKMRDKDENNPFTLINNLEPKNMTIEEIRAKANDEQKARLDAIISISRAAKFDDAKVIELYNSEKTIDAIRSENPAKEKPAEPVNVEAIRASATQEQKARMDAITKSTRAAGLEDSKAIEYFNSEKTIEAIRQEVIEAFVKKDPKVITATVGKEAIDGKRAAIETAILHRISPSVFKDEKNEGGEYRGMTIMEMGKELLVERGISIRGLSKMELAGKIIAGQRDISSSDFPLLLENVSNKLLRGDYPFAPEYWDKISRQTSVSDFKAKSLYQVESVNGMQEVAEGGEIKYTTLKEAKQTLKVASFAQGIKFTRQAMINDDLSAFSLIPNRFVLDWNTKRGDIVWELLTKNVAMDDGKALFHSGHSNLAGTGAILSDVTLEAAILAIKSQKALDGKKILRIMPKYIIVSPEYEITATKLLTSIVPNTVGNINVFSSMGLDIIVEPRLTGKAWYLAADPNATEGIYHAYLDGNEGLRSNREEDFDTDSIKFAVRGEFGANAIDYRGWYKNPGE